jgi:ssDNA thymidine ADP-ribosyltransferase, DarT
MPQPSADFASLISPERALIFRLTHRDNLASILRDGLHSQNGAPNSSEFISIGLPDLIVERSARVIPIAPGGTLADYVPFYFTPCTPMALRIVTGRGVPMRRPAELLFLVSSLDALESSNIQYIVTDRHAKLETAQFGSGRELVADLLWENWRNRDFKRDPEDPEKLERYQAEALVYRHLPVAVLRGIITADAKVQAVVEQQVKASNASLSVRTRRSWYPR